MIKHLHTNPQKIQKKLGFTHHPWLINEYNLQHWILGTFNEPQACCAVFLNPYTWRRAAQPLATENTRSLVGPSSSQTKMASSSVAAGGTQTAPPVSDTRFLSGSNTLLVLLASSPHKQPPFDLKCCSVKTELDLIKSVWVVSGLYKILTKF